MADYISLRKKVLKWQVLNKRNIFNIKNKRERERERGVKRTFYRYNQWNTFDYSTSLTMGKKSVDFLKKLFFFLCIKLDNVILKKQKNFYIPESFNTNILHKLFYCKKNYKGDFVLKTRLILKVRFKNFCHININLSQCLKKS